MRRKLLAEEGEIILLEGGRCQGGIGIEESVELINDICALMTCEPLDTNPKTIPGVVSRYLFQNVLQLCFCIPFLF